MRTNSDILSYPQWFQFNDLGLEALEEKLNKLDMERAAEITRNTCASPTSLVLALLYLDRLRNSNPAYLHSVSSTDLFLVSLVNFLRSILSNFYSKYHTTGNWYIVSQHAGRILGHQNRNNSIVWVGKIHFEN